MAGERQFVEHFVNEDVRVDYEDENDISDCVFRFRLYDAAGAVVVEKTNGSGVAIIDANNYRTNLADGTSHALAAGSYLHEMRITSPVGKRNVTAYGPWVIKNLR